MQFDMRALPMAIRYKIINSTITPRPIAWITTLSEQGVVNAAPYSFFNAVGTEPPLVVLGLLKEPRRRTLKNTATNIVANGEFVVNLVCEDDAETMNECSVDAPADVSEIDYARVVTTPSVVVAPPRIATSPVSFECRKVAALDIGTQQTVIIGEVLMAHIADEFITDREKVYFDTPAMKLIGRTHGSGWYVRNGDSFQMARPAFDPDRLAPKD
ncbi:flavin reductase family protein [Novosphingobium rosa]|uniref:flavin reductase family protein n=1 Tax=Novosphingobium rosa TaxID=76978 RepID=UPI00083499F9|nr:flavin reductase family protein [Novosphingobium rosa]